MAKFKMKKEFRKKLNRVLPIAAGALAVCTGGAYVLNAELYKEKFMPGLSFNGVDASDYTLSEAQEVLEAEKQDYTLTLRFLNDQTGSISAKEIDLVYDCEEELQTIMDSQNRYYWLAGVFGADAPFNLETEVSFDREKLRSLLNSLPQLQKENMNAPQDANITCGDDLTFSIVPEINGNTIDADKLFEAVCEAIISEEKNLNVVTADDIYVQPAVRSKDQVIQDRLTDLNNFLDKSVTIHMSDGTDQVLDKSKLIEWVYQKDKGIYEIDPDHIRGKCEEYAAELAAKDDNYGYFREFYSTNYGIVKLATDNLHGHRLDQKATAETLCEVLLSEDKNEVDLTYSVEVDKKDPRFGGTYVEVDIWSQHVYFYINGELYYDGNCVTGTEGYHSTPSGIFEIIDLQRGRTLEGYNDDGTLSYSAYVDFWMSFYPHYGLHDASWRGSFGGDIYTYDGSHGCVNLSYRTASAIYDAIDYGTPVIVFRGSDDVVIPEDEIDPNTEDAIND